MRGKAALMALASLFLAITILGSKGECMGGKKETVVLKGTVRLVGNEPFPRLVLTVPDPAGGSRASDHLVLGPLAEEIRNRHQGQVVTLECRPCKEKAPGRLPCVEPVRILGAE